jgi:hypothetical protein
MIGDSLWNICRPGLALLALYAVLDGSSDDAASSSFAINFREVVVSETAPGDGIGLSNLGCRSSL